MAPQWRCLMPPKSRQWMGERPGSWEWPPQLSASWRSTLHFPEARSERGWSMGGALLPFSKGPGLAEESKPHLGRLSRRPRRVSVASHVSHCVPAWPVQTRQGGRGGAPPPTCCEAHPSAHTGCMDWFWEPGWRRTKRLGPSSGLRSPLSVGGSTDAWIQAFLREGITLSPSQECTLKVQDGKFKLQDLLVVPMQRVLKYHLLLKVRLWAPGACGIITARVR